MSEKSYEAGVIARVAHIKSHIDKGYTAERLGLFVHNIENNLGDPRACGMMLSSHALANAMHAWFEQRDLDTMRQWCYVAARLDQMWYQMEIDTIAPGAKMLQLLKPLLSNCDSLIGWFSVYDQAYDLKRVQNHKTHDFWAYQSILALRGDWQKLIQRCEQVIADPPKSEKKYIIDHHFFLGLAQGDMARMQEALESLVQPQNVRGRENDESGFTADLISTPAVIYAKIAWLHGFQVKIDSPYIPVEWLSIAPLSEYYNHYTFLK